MDFEMLSTTFLFRFSKIMCREYGHVYPRMCTNSSFDFQKTSRRNYLCSRRNRPFTLTQVPGKLSHHFAANNSIKIGTIGTRGAKLQNISNEYWAQKWRELIKSEIGFEEMVLTRKIGKHKNGSFLLKSATSLNFLAILDPTRITCVSCQSQRAGIFYHEKRFLSVISGTRPRG